MYCVSCGSELVEGALFCSACGSRVISSEPLAEINETPTEQTGGVSAALASGRSRSRLRITPLILLVLVLALTTAVAAASYYVYTQIYLPSAERGSYEAYQVGEDDETGAVTGEATYSFAYATAGDDGRYRFMYPVISSSEPNETIDALNAQLKSEVETAASSALPEELMGYDGTMAWMNGGGNDDENLYTQRRYYVTYFEDGIMSIWKLSKYVRQGVMQPAAVSECLTINLATGKEIAPESVLGVDSEALYSATYETLSSLTYDFALKRDSAGFDAEAAVRGIVANSGNRFYLVPGGIALAIERSEFSTPLDCDSVVVLINDEGEEAFKTGDIIGGVNPDSLNKLPQLPDVDVSSALLV